jgi:hypothetical protein
MSENKLNLRLNEEERLIHEWLKSFYGFNEVYGEDSQTIKQAELVAYNVLQLLIGSNIKDIFKRDSLSKLKEKRAIQQIRAAESKAH